MKNNNLYKAIDIAIKDPRFEELHPDIKELVTAENPNLITIFEYASAYCYTPTGRYLDEDVAQPDNSPQGILAEIIIRAFVSISIAALAGAIVFYVLRLML